MTRRQRVQMAVEHREPDRMPIDCGGMRSTGIMAIAYNRLKDHLGITGGSTKVYDSVQQLALPEQWYLDRFDVNVVDLARAFAQDEDDWVDWQLPDGSAARFPRWLHIEPHNGGWICLNEDGVVIAEMPASQRGRSGNRGDARFGNLFFTEGISPQRDPSALFRRAAALDEHVTVGVHDRSDLEERGAA